MTVTKIDGMPTDAMTPEKARAALVQTSVDALVEVLAYAEGMALVAGGAGVAVEPPEALVRHAIDETVDEQALWLPRLGTFLVHLRRQVRLRIGEHLLREARVRVGTGDPWAAQLGLVQLGNLRGVEKLAHYLGEMAPSFRAGDPRVHAAAHRLHDYVRTRLAPWAVDGADAEPPRAEPVVVLGPRGSARLN